MNTKLATILSIVGVLGAGAAAAVVNTTVFDGATESAVGSPSAIDPPVVASTLATVAVGAPEGTVAFEVGSAGVVTVDGSGPLRLVSTQPSPGWTVGEATTDHDGSIAVPFSSPAGTIAFRASLVGGRVVATVDTSAATTSTVSSTIGSTVATTPVSGPGVSTTDVTGPDVSAPDSSAPGVSSPNVSTSVTVDDNDDDEDNSNSGPGGGDDDDGNSGSGSGNSGSGSGNNGSGGSGGNSGSGGGGGDDD